MSVITFMGSVGGSAINGGNVTLTYPASARAQGNVMICAVTFGTSKAETLSVASSSGAAYTQIVATQQSSNVRFGVFRRISVSSLETTCTITPGTGGSTDTTTGCLLILRGVDETNPEDVAATFTNGSGTTPDSPSITVASCGCAIITAIGVGLSTAAPTTPTSTGTFLNRVVGNGADSNPATSAQAWITNTTSSPLDPGAWTIGTASTWIAATIAIRREWQLPPGTAGFRTSADTAKEARRVVITSY